MLIQESVKESIANEPILEISKEQSRLSNPFSEYAEHPNPLYSNIQQDEVADPIEDPEQLQDDDSAPPIVVASKRASGAATAVSYDNTALQIVMTSPTNTEDRAANANAGQSTQQDLIVSLQNQIK